MPSEWRIKLYRGAFYAVRKGPRGTERQSLRTDDLATAKQRLEDQLAAAKRRPETVGDYVEAYLAEKAHTARNPHNMAAAWKAAKPTFAHLRPDQITRAICRAYDAERTKLKRKPATIRKELETIRTALNFHKAAGAVFWMPAPPPAKNRVLNKPEFRALLWTVTARTYPHLRAFIALALGTGGRSRALLDLTWDRVNFDSGVIQLATEDQHGRKGRASVPMTKRVRRYLKVLKRSGVSRYVIEYAGDKVGSVRNGFRSACKQAGLTDVTPHVLRHTAASWMAEDGASMVEIARYLGHSDDRLTQRRYAHLSPDFLRRASRSLD